MLDLDSLLSVQTTTVSMRHHASVAYGYQLRSLVSHFAIGDPNEFIDALDSARSVISGPIVALFWRHNISWMEQDLDIFAPSIGSVAVVDFLVSNGGCVVLNDANVFSTVIRLVSKNGKQLSISASPDETLCGPIRKHMPETPNLFVCGRGCYALRNKPTIIHATDTSPIVHYSWKEKSDGYEIGTKRPVSELFSQRCCSHKMRWFGDSKSVIGLFGNRPAGEEVLLSSRFVVGMTSCPGLHAFDTSPVVVPTHCKYRLLFS